MVLSRPAVLRDSAGTVRLLGVTVAGSSTIPWPELPLTPLAAHPGHVHPVAAGHLQGVRCPTPLLKHWWNSTLHLIARGLTTSLIPPIHLFRGALDLATTRLSGRTAPPHPGGAPCSFEPELILRAAQLLRLSSKPRARADGREDTTCHPMSATTRCRRPPTPRPRNPPGRSRRMVTPGPAARPGLSAPVGRTR